MCRSVQPQSGDAQQKVSEDKTGQCWEYRVGHLQQSDGSRPADDQYGHDRRLGVRRNSQPFGYLGKSFVDKRRKRDCAYCESPSTGKTYTRLKPCGNHDGKKDGGRRQQFGKTRCQS